MWKLRAVSKYEDGYYGGVRFPDLPGVVAFGRDHRAAVQLAVRAAAAHMAEMIHQGRPLPLARTPGHDGELVDIPPRLAAKLVLRREMARSGWSVDRLARELQISDAEARELIDLDGPASFVRIRSFFARLKGRKAAKASASHR